MAANIQSLYQEAKHLSPAEKRELARMLTDAAFFDEIESGKTPPINELSRLPFGVTFEIVDIDDDRNKPKVIVNLGRHVLAEIDVYEAVKTNSGNLSHPAILAAIIYWELRIKFYRHLAMKPKSQFKRALGGKKIEQEYEKAEKNMRRLGELIFNSAKARALKKENAFLFLAEKSPLIDSLWAAFQIIRDQHNKLIKIRNREAKLKMMRTLIPQYHTSGLKVDPQSLASYLRPIRNGEEIIKPPSIDIKNDLDLTKPLRDQEHDEIIISYFERAGYRLLNDSSDWGKLRDDFLSWYYGREVNSIQKYRSLGRHQEIQERWYEGLYTHLTSSDIKAYLSTI